ncbi:MAG: glutathione S-transferase [Rhodospirillaceae bacterium]|nr:glutathione S-transferase [Rhodospirillaceae bacterium]|tara:strand:+ start:1004 stop:1825 length:822 start_codon:yes stop_codon:yes gene_type:complete
MAVLRIFSYLPNPRLMKATIAARLCDLEIEIRGDRPRELKNWLWDFDAHLLTDADQTRLDVISRPSHTGFDSKLHKTESFLKAHPFGTVPAAFSPDGTIGIFESNSILRAVARLGADKFPLYGKDSYEASRIDSFLDAALVLARQSQIYLLSLSQKNCDKRIRDETATALDIFLTGIDEAASETSEGLINNRLSIADIAFVCEICQLSRDRAHLQTLADNELTKVYDRSMMEQKYPNAITHFQNLCLHGAFAPDINPLMEQLSKREADFAYNL